MWSACEHFSDHIEIGLPHVGADELDVRAEFGSEHSEESLGGFDGSLLADPEQASQVRIDLIDQGEVLVAFGILDLVNTDGRNRTQGAMCQAPVHDILHGVANRVPRGAERFSSFLPGQFARPASQKDHVGFGEGMLTIGPGNFLDHDAAGGAVDPAHAIEEKNQEAPNRYELERTLGQVVVAGRWPVATGTDGFGTNTWPYPDLKALAIWAEAGWLVNETREAIAMVKKRDNLRVENGCHGKSIYPTTIRHGPRRRLL